MTWIVSDTGKSKTGGKNVLVRKNTDGYFCKLEHSNGLGDRGTLGESGSEMQYWPASV